MVGITGHQRLDNPSDWQWVEREINNVLSRLPGPVIGITSLAIGADQLFARSILKHHGTLEVIVPFADYERTFTDSLSRFKYNELLFAASQVDVLEQPGSDEESFFAAGKAVVDRSDFIIAVWNGRPAKGLGGTADIVRYAQKQGKEVVHLNPTTQTVIKYAGVN